MGIKITLTIEGATAVDRKIWKARLKPEEVSRLGESPNRIGPYSILLVDAAARFDEKSGSLTLDPGAARLLNIGGTDALLILGVGPEEAISPGPAAEPESAKAPFPPLPKEIPPGDRLFIKELPAELREMGEFLLSGVRGFHPGELSYDPRGGRFAETPDAFWTVRIQASPMALRITVRGAPERFGKIPRIELKNDKFGYSAFEVNQVSLVPIAVSVIRQAGEK